MPRITSGPDLASMARAGAVVAATLETVIAAVTPGVRTGELDVLAEGRIRDAGAVPSFKGYHGFPATLCTSLNDRVVHGFPDPDRRLVEGDLLSIDCGAVLEGFHGDSAVTLIVGGEDAAPGATRRLVGDTHAALWRGIAAMRVGGHLGDIGAAIQATAVAGGYGLVRQYVGHGIGRALHEEPAVPNYGVAGQGQALQAGWVLAIEPMLTLGSGRTRTLDDGWTVVTTDGSLAAHWEHTVALTPEGPQVLTARSDEPTSPIG